MKTAAILLLATGFARGADTFGASSLVGLKIVSKYAVAMAYCRQFVFTEAGKNLGADGLLKLAIGRIAIDPASSDAWMLLNIQCLPIQIAGKERGHAVHLSLNLQRFVTADDGHQFSAVTWAGSDLRICGTEDCPETIRSASKDLLDEFLSQLVQAESDEAKKAKAGK